MKTKKPIHIVKVQVPLMGDVRPNTILIYPASRSPMTAQGISREAHAQLRGDPKAYFEGYLNSKGFWVLGKRVADQPW